MNKIEIKHPCENHVEGLGTIFACQKDTGTCESRGACAILKAMPDIFDAVDEMRRCKQQVEENKKNGPPYKQFNMSLKTQQTFIALGKLFPEI